MISVTQTKAYRLFIDLDGVLADFFRGVTDIMGKDVTPESIADIPNNELWKRINTVPDFFARLHPIPGAEEFWDRLKHLNPIVLTGLPTSQKNGVQDKISWVHRHIDPTARVEVCESKDKIKRARALCASNETPVLVDDWFKFRSVWEAGGGIFILHSSFKDSYSRLQAYFKLTRL